MCNTPLYFSRERMICTLCSILCTGWFVPFVQYSAQGDLSPFNPCFIEWWPLRSDSWIEKWWLHSPTKCSKHWRVSQHDERNRKWGRKKKKLTCQEFALVISVNQIIWKTEPKLKNKKPSRCHLLFYCTSYRLNMFQALLCPSSRAREYDVDYLNSRFVIGLLYVGG